MCPGSGGSTDTESRGVIICDDLISKNGGGGDYKNEDTMRVRGEVKFVHGLLRRFSVNGNVESLPLQEASFPLSPSPSLSLSLFMCVGLACVCISPFQEVMSSS
jgi:hypothetical protein